jgi:ribosomal-protein-alanine N-acetyltransferase
MSASMIVLETERLLFRDHTRDDLEAFCALEADPEVRRFVGGAPRTRQRAEEKFRSFLRPAPKDRLSLWATVFKPDDRYIGYCGVYPHFGVKGPIPKEGALGYTLAREYWRRGLATEAARAFVDFGFDVIRLRRIVAMVEVGNGASVRVLEKLGFSLWQLETVNRRSFYHLELRPDSQAGARGARSRAPSSPD